MGTHRDSALLVAGLALVVAALLACDPNLTPAGDVNPTDPTFDCIPDLDGMIDASELPLVLDVAVDYAVTSDVAVDLAGAADAEGRRVWDFSTPASDDDRVSITVRPLAGAWYESAMIGATFVVGAADADGLDGAYARDEAGLRLVGLASPDPSPPGGQTLLVYDSPVLVLRFPIASGQSYSAAATITGGTLDGLPYNGTDTYNVAVDGIGRAELPGVTFTQATRVRTDVEIVPAVGGVSTSTRQVSFFFECFGEVVRANSRADEPSADFTRAAELRRFAL